MSMQRCAGTPANHGAFELRESFPTATSVQSTPTPFTPTKPQQRRHVNTSSMSLSPNYFHLPFLDNAIKKVYEYHNQQQKSNNSGKFSVQLYNRPYIHSGDVIEFYGPSCGGKTTILYHVIVTTILPKYWMRDEKDDEDVKIELNGLGKGVLFFDLDGRCDIKRLYTMIMCYLRNKIEQTVKERNSQQCGMQQQLPTPLSSFSPSRSSQLSQEEQGELCSIDLLPTEQELDMIARNSLRKLHIFQPNASIEYLATLLSLPEYITEIQEKEDYEFNYLMIDSINSFYWQDKSEEIGEKAINSGNDVDTDSDDDGNGRGNENSINDIEIDNFENVNEGEIVPTSSPSIYYNGRQSRTETPRSSINSINSNTSNNNFQYYIVQALQTLLDSTNLITLTTNWVTSENQQQNMFSSTSTNSRIPQELSYTTVSSYSLLKYKFVIAKQLLPQYSDDRIPQMADKYEDRRNLLKEPYFFGRLILPECDERCGEIFSFRISEGGIVCD